MLKLGFDKTTIKKFIGTGGVAEVLALVDEEELELFAIPFVRSEMDENVEVDGERWSKTYWKYFHSFWIKSKCSSTTLPHAWS